jgi:cardiolipin synthase
MLVRYKGLAVAVHPTRVGKYATFSLTVLVVLALLDDFWGTSAWLHAYTQVFGIIAAQCVVISAAQYLFRYRVVLR